MRSQPATLGALALATSLGTAVAQQATRPPATPPPYTEDIKTPWTTPIKPTEDPDRARRPGAPAPGALAPGGTSAERYEKAIQ